MTLRSGYCCFAACANSQPVNVGHSDIGEKKFYLGIVAQYQ
jgi:hypothetical protein